MAVNPLLIERIYEAAVLPDLWPAVLQDVSDLVGARGATIVSRSRTGSALIVSPAIQEDANDFVSEGWTLDTEYTAPLFAEHWPGFRAETAYRTPEEIAALPVHAEFLTPRGYIAGVATVIQGAADHALHLALEGFPSHSAAELAVDALDDLRPHAARSASLAMLLHDQQVSTTVAALQLAGVAAAVVSPDRRLRAVNDHFAGRLGNRMIEHPTGLRFANRFLQSQFEAALAALGDDMGVRSIAIAADEDEPACAIHLLPLKRGARDVFGWDGVLLLFAEAGNASIPGADLLRLLFDLTPAEARVARHLVEGRAPAELARSMSITEATARVHLRCIFAKTGARRQPELVQLLLGLGGPGNGA